MDKEILENAGIDYAAGLLHFAGKEELYRKYLIKFKEDTHADEGIMALDKGDYKEVLGQIHALKGLSGTLGFSELFRKTSIVVAELREEKYENLTKQLREIKQEQNRLLQVIGNER